MNRRGILAGAAVVAMALAGWQGTRQNEARQRTIDAEAAQNLGVEDAHTDDPARQAFEAHVSSRILTAEGTVERLLADDRDGSPHQRFILRTKTGLTLLVAHNIDLAPRLEGLKAGEALSVVGEYEWNEQGGVMHWTHHDPGGSHPSGYIEWRGRRYQ